MMLAVSLGTQVGSERALTSLVFRQGKLQAVLCVQDPCTWGC